MPNSIKTNTNIHGLRKINFFSNKGPDPLQRGNNYENVLMGWGHLKIFFSRITGPMLTRLGTNHH
jgi:hypothetical protein